jgi:hypothetical protein
MGLGITAGRIESMLRGGFCGPDRNEVLRACYEGAVENDLIE